MNKKSALHKVILLNINQKVLVCFCYLFIYLFIYDGVTYF
jgi:hypothetical protein